MSWDSYIDNLITNTKDGSGSINCEKACIITLVGNKLTTDGHASALKLSSSEVENIARSFKSKDFTSFMSGGINAEGTRFQFLRDEDGKIVHAKKKGSGTLIMAASKTTVVIGKGAEGMDAGKLLEGVSMIREYLESLNM